MCCLPSDLFLYEEDFQGDGATYLNKAMRGMRFRLFLDGDLQLEDHQQWEYVRDDALARWGFIILIPNFDITTNTKVVVQFY